jgi:2,6-dihydroxypyridine 3-monooxygenase
MAALALREVGCTVDVFERVPQRLEGQGAGLRIVPEMARLLGERAGIDLAPVSTFVAWFRHIGEGNSIVSEKETPGQFTSWGALHRALALGFDSDRYHLGEACVGLDRRPDGCDIRFASGRVEGVDLAVFADGILSTGRRLLAPEVRPTYAGYVAWRGFLRADELEPATLALLDDGVNHCVLPYSHTTVYPIPDPLLREDQGRFFNFVWYRNVAEGTDLNELMVDRSGVARPISLPAGAVQERFIEAMKADAKLLMPPAGAEVILKTKEPFVQALYDVEPQRMAYGRACLMGDAAFATRPHAGAATTKAAINAWRLADYLVQYDGDVDKALAAWEPAELEVGRAFVARNKLMGRRSLVESRFNPVDPEHMPGLVAPGR